MTFETVQKVAHAFYVKEQYATAAVFYLEAARIAGEAKRQVEETTALHFAWLSHKAAYGDILGV